MKVNCLPTGIGSLPFFNAKQACDFAITHCPDIPFWPQLPGRSIKENMYTMFTEHLPGVVLENGKLFIDSSRVDEFEFFYTKFVEHPLREFSIGCDYALALQYFLSSNFPKVTTAVKGHVTGPVSFGLQINDEYGKPSLYNDLLIDVIVKTLAGIIRWQEKRLAEISNQTVIFIDEPYMSFIGSTIVSLNSQKIQTWINELVAAAQGKIGVHCCANTDWSLLLNTDIQVISFDAYEFANNFLLYRKELNQFLRKGGIIAWGIVPTAADQIQQETKQTLYAKFEALISQLEKGTNLSRESILASSLITPACGLGTRDEATTKRVFKITGALSRLIQQNYNLR